MRDLNECQAEVFRRSEKRIKERKQHRKHILLTCIPLVLCIPLFCAFFLRDMVRTTSKAPTGTRHETNTSPENWNSSSPASLLHLEVSGLGFSKTYTDTATIMLISDQLNSDSYEASTESVEDQDHQHSVTEDFPNRGTGKEEAKGENNTGILGDDILYGETSPSTSIGYTITLTTDAGTYIEYYLSGNTLENRTKNQSRNLSHSEVNMLKKLLGIPEMG